MSNYIFVIITSDTCGHCTRFVSNHYTDLISRLKLVEGLEIIHIKLENGKYQHLPIRMTKDHLHLISDYVSWFPEFLLVNKNNWYNNQELEGYVFNGKINNSKDEMKVEQEPDQNLVKPITSDKIMEWVTSKVTQSMPKTSTQQSRTGILSSRGHGYVAPKINIKYNQSTYSNIT